jgi:energy-coupling factor transport system ATP-binding protein
MILFQNLTYTYPGAAQPALRAVALHVPEGGFALVVWPSGCGKSTLARCVGGMMGNPLDGTPAPSCPR